MFLFSSICKITFYYINTNITCLTKMSYNVGIAYSNLENNFGPVYYTGVAIKNLNFEKIHIGTKNDFRAHFDSNQNYFDLEALENELNKIYPFIKMVTIEKNENFYNIEKKLVYLSDIYYEIINEIASSDLAYSLNNLTKCYLRHPIDKNGDLIPIGLDFTFQYGEYSYEFQSNTYSKHIQVARIISWYKHVLNFRNNSNWLNKQFKENAKFNFYKISRLRYASPFLEEYYSYNVGAPYIQLLDSNHKGNILYLNLNDSLDFIGISKSCNGLFFDDESSRRCLDVSKTKPFGSLINDNNELCKTCNDDSKNITCLQKKCKCDGILEECENIGFITNICHNDYCLYITIFNSKIKIGRSQRRRIINRLIEQSAFDALILYPISWLPIAAKWEGELTDYLRNAFSSPEYKVSERILTIDRLEHIKKKIKSNEDSRSIYDDIKQSLVRHPFFGQLEMKYVKLKDNWMANEDISRTRFIPDFKFNHIKGKINAIIGSFIVVGDGIYNLGNKEGYMIAIKK